MLDIFLAAAAEAALAPRNINMHAPLDGYYAAAVIEAAQVPDPWIPFAQCVLKRETGAVLHNKQSREDARNKTSTASGRWQMLDSQWREGGSWLVFKRLKRTGVDHRAAKKVQARLAETPIASWPGIWQDIAFIQSIKEGGWANWANGGYCDTLAVK